jgi:hypothetical protein
MRRIYRPIAIVLLVAQAGCYQTRTLASPAELAGARTAKLMVTTANGSEVTIVAARVLDDTIFGFDASGKQTAVPFSDAKVVKVREVSNTKTLALGAVVVVMLVAAAVLVKGKGTQAGGGVTTTDCDKHPDSAGCPGT